MNRLLAAMLLFVTAATISSCHSRIFRGKKHRKHRDTATANIVVDTTAVSVPAEYITPANSPLANSLKPILDARIPFRTFSGKAKLSLESPDGSFDFSANFRIAHDSLVWIHVSALGGLYPVARILVTPDSFFMVNYREKEVTFVPVSDARKFLPVAVQFTQLQNFFTGAPLLDGTITAAESLDSSWRLTTEDTSFVQSVTYKKADSLLSSGTLNMRRMDDAEAIINYYNYELVSDRRLSTTRTVRVRKGVQTYTLDMNLVNTEFDKDLEFPFSIPGNYTVRNQ